MSPPDDHPAFPVDPFPHAGPRWEAATEEEEAAFIAAVEEGVADTDAGRVVSGEAVTAWVRSWFTDEELPPPRCGD